MNQSKYNQKYDPKHNGSQPAVTPASVQVPTATPAANAKPAEPVAAPQPGTKSQPDGQATPATVRAAAPNDTKSGEAMVSEGGHTATADVPHAVREPSALPAAPAEGEKAPAILAKPIS